MLPPPPLPPQKKIKRFDAVLLIGKRKRGRRFQGNVAFQSFTQPACASTFPSYHLCVVVFLQSCWTVLNFAFNRSCTPLEQLYLNLYSLFCMSVNFHAVMYLALHLTSPRHHVCKYVRAFTHRLEVTVPFDWVQSTNSLSTQCLISVNIYRAVFKSLSKCCQKITQ